MNPDNTKTHDPTPEQLLQLLDLQIAQQRAKKKSSATRRAILLAGGILLILGGALVAFLVLQEIIQNQPRPGTVEAPFEN